MRSPVAGSVPSERMMLQEPFDRCLRIPLAIFGSSPFARFWRPECRLALSGRFPKPSLALPTPNDRFRYVDGTGENRLVRKIDHDVHARVDPAVVFRHLIAPCPILFRVAWRVKGQGLIK